MDSMKSLNSSLPSSRPSAGAPPEELLQAFRMAALSVTNLYKSATTSQNSARQTGYQDALEDLLKFLDRENLGLQDGEGWRIRQWATTRYDRTPSQQEDEEVEEEREEIETRSRDVSQDRDEHITIPGAPNESTTVPRPEVEDESDSAERPMFQFTANTQQDYSMHHEDANSSRTHEDAAVPSSSQTSPIRVEVLNRNSRTTSRSHSNRHNIRPNPRDFNVTAGTKRKLQFSDFFDISSLNDRRDGSGGGGSKRGRIS